MHDSAFIGSIRVSPPLNDHEAGFLLALSDTGRTLRSTPTGRGNSDVPFARLAWQVCNRGCCLWWDGFSAATKWMAPSLTFLIDHLFRVGAEGEGRRQFEGFTFDHVLCGVVVGQGHDDADITLVEVTDNVVAGRLVQALCSETETETGTGTRPASVTQEAPPAERAGRRPSNVIQLRPRQAR